MDRQNSQWCRQGTHGKAVMHCARCHRRVVQERISDPPGTTQRCDVVRCLNCGNIQDAMIQANRNTRVRRLSSRVPRLSVAGCSLDRLVDSAMLPQRSDLPPINGSRSSVRLGPSKREPV